MAELILIKTNNPKEVKELLEQKQITYKIYREYSLNYKDTTKEKICFYCSKKVNGKPPQTIKIEENNYLVHNHCFKEIGKSQKANQVFIDEWENFGVVCGEKATQKTFNQNLQKNEGKENYRNYIKHKES